MNYWGYIIRYDELALKGKNRGLFEQQLLKNIRHKLQGHPFELSKVWGRLLLKADRSEAIDRGLAEVFGIASCSPVLFVPSEREKIEAAALSLIADRFQHQSSKGVTFRVSTNRVDKTFQPTSPEINKQMAEVVLDKYPDLVVNLKQARLDVGIEIRREGAFIFTERLPGLRGLPVGSGGRVLTLLSGGIDSPIAAWHMMRRGCQVNFVHFFAPPYTGIQSKQKVLDLARHLMRFQKEGSISWVPFTKIQEAIKEHCHERFRTVLYRRMMQRIATELAGEQRASALVTGENLGQVASQTLENISAISHSTRMLVLRPLISFNKQEIINIAKRVGTYDTSILPFDDCCTLFQPQKPATRSWEDQLLREEERVSVDSLIQETLLSVETEKL